MKVEHMIPNIYEQSSDIRTVARLFDAEFEILKYYTDHILDCYSPEHCPQPLLDDLAEHIGFDYQELKTVMYNRVVLKNFIKNMIRYRGSATGIGNAAAIDIRYRQTYPETSFDVEAARRGEDPWVPNEDAGQQIPMNFHESIDIDKTWIDTDIEAGIIYLFIIASDYFPKITESMTPEEKKANYEERLRRLLDLAYLQEYVRPVGMYLLPMVARKVNAQTDLTVKAVRIPDYERNSYNGVEGTPNASMQHQYDRMLFAKVENPDDELSVEPWVRTLYHSQLAGTLNHEYFQKPVYHIEGKFLYYDHDELLETYQQIQENVPGMAGMKIGDSLYNPNIIHTPADQNFSYGPEASDDAEPLSLQQRGVAEYTYDDLAYIDPVVFEKPRVYQDYNTIARPVITDPAEPYPIYLDVCHVPQLIFNLGETLDAANPATLNGIMLSIPEILPTYSILQSLDDIDHSTLEGTLMASGSTYLIDAYTGTHQSPTLNTPGDGDDGTNKNLMINLFQVDEKDESQWTGAHDVQISGKGPVPRNPVPYDAETNGPPTGDDVFWSLKNSEGQDNPDDIIP